MVIYQEMRSYTRKYNKKQMGGTCAICYAVVGLLGLVYYFDKPEMNKN